MCKNRNILSAYMDELKLRGSGVQSVSPDADGGQGSMQCVRDLKHGERVHIHAWLKNKP